MQFTRFLKAMFVLTDLLISSVPASAAEQSIQSQPSITGSAVVLGPPAATESPKFDYTFELIFKGGKCTVAQQRKLRVIFNNVAGLADRVELWKKDAFFEWSDDVDNWFGSDSSKNVAYIKNNFLRLSAAVKPFNQRKTDGKWNNNGGNGWINTYLYVGCNYDWGWGTSLSCTNRQGVNANNHYGFLNRWDNIYWNICSDYWTQPNLVDVVKKVMRSPTLDIHDMVNYWDLPEFQAFGQLIGIRSVGINTMKLGDAYRSAHPVAVWREARLTGKDHGTELLKVSPAAYYFAAMAITVPEAFNRRAYPIKVEKEYQRRIVDANVTSVLDSENMVSYFNDTATVSMTSGSADPLITPYTDAGVVMFSSLVDTIHTGPPQCFSAWSTAACDCGPLKGTLTVMTGASSCIVEGATVTLQDWATVAPEPIASLSLTDGLQTATYRTGSATTVLSTNSRTESATASSSTKHTSRSITAAANAVSSSVLATPALPVSIAPAAPHETPAAGPHETSHNDDGSSACGDINRQSCIDAFQQYNNDITYHTYTSYVASAGDTFINEWLGGTQGCTAKFSCDTDAEYATGMNHVESAFETLYQHSDVNICGTSYLSNGCSVSVDMCNNCVPHIPCFALSASDVRAGRPCFGQFKDGLDRVCKLNSISCGRAGICGRSCSCTDKSEPTPFIEPELKRYTCPDVADLPDPPPGWPVS
ncbi:hypothetical protein MMC21_007508 [Puttea exsequens]|nr:hypothetical protein [Puttea exsequens]